MSAEGSMVINREGKSQASSGVHCFFPRSQLNDHHDHSARDYMKKTPIKIVITTIISFSQVLNIMCNFLLS